MVYLENDSTYIQRVYIPRDDEPTAATTGHTFTLQRKDYIVTENGTIRIHPDAGYDGISGGTIGTYVSAATGVTFKHLTAEENGLYVPTGDSVYSGVTVNVDLEGPYNSGYTSGYTDGYNTGYTEGYSDGYNSGYTTGYTSGYTSGETHQKSLLSAVTLTQNGRTTYPNGVSAVTVNVDLVGPFNSGYTSGYTKGYASGYTSGKTDGYNSGRTDGYNSGKTDGYASGYTSGETHQKSLLSSVTLTQNATTTYQNGVSSVTVNVDTSGPFNSGYTSGYTNGYSSGYTSGSTNGFTSGVTHQKSLLSSVTITQPSTSITRENGWSAVTTNIDTTPYYDSGYTEGYGSGYTSGYTSGSTDGYNSGVTEQKSLLSSTGFTGNGTWVNNDGWSSVTVNYPIYSAGLATIIENGRYNYDFWTIMGFEGAWNNITLEVAVPQTGGTGVLDSLLVSENNRAYYPPQGIDGYSAVTVAIDTSDVFNSGYASGVTDGRNEGYSSGVTDGMSSQKALLSSTTITSNGTFTRENGWSAVTVNIQNANIVTLTQAEYDVLSPKDNNTIYLIKG